MKRNRKLFYQIADITETYPERYEQCAWGFASIPEHPGVQVPSMETMDRVIYDGNEYACGTAHCIAGWALTLSKTAKPVSYPVWNRLGDTILRTSFDWSTVQLENGNVRGIIEWAADELGLSIDEANDLFSGGWMPRQDLSVGDALRLIGDGASIYEVSYH